MSEARSVLVTGGNGFIGSWVVKNLLERGESPVVLDLGDPSELVRQLAGDEFGRIEWVTGDICDADQVNAVVAQADSIVHLAGVLTPFCLANPVMGAKINIMGTVNVLDAARQHEISGISYASSAAVYGKTSLDLAPSSLYGALKLSAEFIAAAFHSEFGIDSMGLRPFVVYGPGRESGASAGISLACKAAALGDAYEISFGGQADAVFVADVADAFVKSALEPLEGAMSCSVSGELTSVDGLAAAIRSIVPSARISAGVGDLGIHADISALDIRTCRNDILHTELRDGLLQTIDSYRR